MEDFFTIDELHELIRTQERACLSIFMPAVQAGNEVRQNPTRFKNLLTRAERLLLNGKSSVQASEFLAPLRALTRDQFFWANQSRGLALFRSSRMIKMYRIPSEFREIVGIADHFHITPLISFLRQEYRFYVLALSKKEVRLIECSFQKAIELDVPNLPKGMDEALQYDDPQNRMLFRTGTSKHQEKSTATFHSHGAGQEKGKDDLFKYFQLVNKSLDQFLNEQKAPLIVAAVDYILPMYAEANTYPHLLAQGIAGNPEGLKPEELKREAKPLIDNILREDEQRAISDFEEKTVRLPSSTDLLEVVPSAYNSRVDSLFLSKEDEVWGHFDSEKSTAISSKEMEAGHYDLLNFAALHTMSNGGTVIPVPKALVPRGGVVAALFRY